MREDRKHGTTCTHSYLAELEEVLRELEVPAVGQTHSLMYMHMCSCTYIHVQYVVWLAIWAAD